jgi:hypothetical protein
LNLQFSDKKLQPVLFLKYCHYYAIPWIYF